MTHILHQIDHAIELLDDAYPSMDRSIRETLERAQAEITRLLAMTTPQPIETAPKDGTTFIAFSPNGICRCTWTEVNECPYATWWSDVDDNIWFTDGPHDAPTHWLPLPEDPK